jgi:hypothetical protein
MENCSKIVKLKLFGGEFLLKLGVLDFLFAAFASAVIHFAIFSTKYLFLRPFFCLFYVNPNYDTQNSFFMFRSIQSMFVHFSPSTYALLDASSVRNFINRVSCRNNRFSLSLCWESYDFIRRRNFSTAMNIFSSRILFLPLLFARRYIVVG